ATRLGDTPGSGRNYTGRPAGPLDTSAWDVLEADGTLRGATATPWGDSPVYVVVADGGPSGLYLPEAPGGPLRLYGPEEAAEIIARDPERPPGVPVVLLTSHAGDGLLTLPRTVADRAGVETWAMDARYRLLPTGDGRTRVVFRDDPDGGRPLGQWIASPPGMLPDPAQRPPEGSLVLGAGTGFAFTEDALITFTLVDPATGRSTGRAAHEPGDFAENEWSYRLLPRVRHFARWDPETDTEGPLRELPAGMRNAYVFSSHGRLLQGGVEAPHVVQRPDGSTSVENEDITGVETGLFIRRRPSFRGRSSVWLDACSGHALHPEYHDPLVHLSGAQQVANTVDALVWSYADDATFAEGEEGGRPDRVLIHGPLDVQREDIGVSVPEIPDAYLPHLADWAGLPADLPEREVRARRFTRALRHAFGTELESPAHQQEYARYLRGLGALELTRWRAGATAPITGRELGRLVTLHHHGRGLPVPDDAGRALAGLLAASGDAATDTPAPHRVPPYGPVPYGPGSAPSAVPSGAVPAPGRPGGPDAVART
ncbi:hypothetical protein GTY54_39345, partial [Streptomyces sp. SID625]|nr:hypothetical protein [Streptomyces sp. SID625]